MGLQCHVSVTCAATGRSGQFKKMASSLTRFASIRSLFSIPYWRRSISAAYYSDGPQERPTPRGMLNAKATLFYLMPIHTNKPIYN